MSLVTVTAAHLLTMAPGAEGPDVRPEARDPPEVQRLVAAARGGDRVAFGDLVTLHERLVYRTALAALGLLWRDGYRYNKCGVILVELGTAGSVQNDLWMPGDTPKTRALMQAVDRLNAEWGRETVRVAASGIHRGWKLRSDRKSPRYTTDWDELLHVYK